MTRAVFAIVVEVLALGFVYVLLGWANRKIDEKLAGAVPQPVPREGARTDKSPDSAGACAAGVTAGTQAPLFCPGCRVVHEPPLHPPRWPVVLYSPCERGYVAQQFEVVGELAAAHVALYRVPRFGNEARA